MRELILLGRGPSWKQCTWDAEVWATASILLEPDVRIDCISKVFIQEDLDVGRGQEAVEIAMAHNIPVVSTQDYATEQFPLQGIEETFKPCYLRNTISYMMALAIYMEYDKLKLFGIDQGPDYEYLATKPYVFFWLGVATGWGIEHEFSSQCLLFEPYLQELKEKMDTKTWGRIKMEIGKHL